MLLYCYLALDLPDRGIDCSRDAGGDLVLHDEYVGHLPVVALCPELART
jgi:hypothetical protein